MAAGDDLRARIGASEVGGVMLFRPNISTPGAAGGPGGGDTGGSPE